MCDATLCETACQGAVRHAWHALRAMGTDEVAAFRSCTTLYRLRHPGTTLREAQDRVAIWLDPAECNP